MFVIVIKCDTGCSGNNHRGGLHGSTGFYMSVYLQIFVRRHDGIIDSDSEKFAGV